MFSIFTKRPKISIIMPFYNVPNEYFEMCINSILNQTLKEIEIILINDCSQYNEYEILRPYLSDKRIRYYENKVNLGWAKNKNIYAKKARGEYIAGVDTDDYISLDFFEKLYNKAKKYDADLCYSFVNLLDNNTGNIIPFRDSTKVFLDLKDKVFNYKDMKTSFFEICTASWNRIYKRDFYFKNIFYCEDLGQFEDYLSYFTGIINAKKIAMVDEDLYFYRQNIQNSNSSKIKDYSKFELYHQRINNFFKSQNLYVNFRLNLIEMILRDFLWFEKTPELQFSTKKLLVEMDFSVEDFENLQVQYKKEEIKELFLDMNK